MFLMPRLTSRSSISLSRMISFGKSGEGGAHRALPDAP